jgi:predicted permease
MTSHLALLEAEYERRGMSAEEARLAARRAMGSVALAKDMHRDARSFAWIADLRQDLRHAFRSLRRTPGLTAAVAVTLALGIGAATTMFSVAYGVLLRPLPYRSPDRLVRVWERHPGATAMLTESTLSNITYHAWQTSGRTIESLGAFSATTFTVGLEEPTRIGGAALSPSVFRLLGTTPVLGRFFTNEDARQGATPVVVLSENLWRDRFGGDLGVVGRTVVIDQQRNIIVGVAPASFAFPDPSVRLWQVMELPPPAGGPNQRVMAGSVIARLADGISPEQAAAEATSIARSQNRPPVVEILWGKGGPVEVEVRPIVGDMTAPVQPAVLLTLAAVGGLLLIACANVANLLLARGVSRQREVAVRAALGAGRGRMIRQLLTESVVLSILGGMLGMVIASLLVRAMPALVPRQFPRLDDVRVDWLMCVVASVVTVTSGVIAGLVPAFGSVRRDMVTALRDGAGATVGPIAGKARRTLLAGEAAMAVMLLVVALLVGRSLMTLMRVDAGYDADNVVTARVFLPGSQRGQAETDVFVPILLERVRALPGVIAVGAGGMAPFGRLTMATQLTVNVPGRVPVAARSRVYVVTPGYAEALRLRLRSGRYFESSDLASGTQTMLVNEEFVRTFLQGVGPVGFTTESFLTRGARAEIVGVVGNVLKEGLRSAVQPEVYVVPAHRYSLRSEIHLLARTAGDTSALMRALRETVHSLRADAAVDDLTTLRVQVSESVGKERLATTTLAGLALMATLLAAVGLYGVLSHVVSARQRELGVRAALGASGRQIARLVIGDGMRTTGVGLVIGLAAAAGVSRFLGSMLFGIEPLDRLAFVLAGVLLTAVAFVACVVPARRAARVDPIEALRAS